MRLVQLKEDDERFGHMAGDLFIVEQADYDSDKVVGVKLEAIEISNSFYKDQVRAVSVAVAKQQLFDNPRPPGGADE